ncbi:MAG: hypothetical protein JXP73_01190 [Deltaproteobacteria bacterium]|nr:hypothetical protein [Deltaproteobacteria bacterium]
MLAKRTCRRHPREPAGWFCATCRAHLCPDCVSKQPGGPKGTQIPVCCACGRGVETITVHRSQAQPFSRRLWMAFDFPLGSAGIISLFFVGFVRALTSYIGASMMFVYGSAFVLRQGLYWAFVFFIIRGVAAGQRRMGVFGFTDIQSDIIAPAGKGILATAIVWLPAILYIYLASGQGLGGLVNLDSYMDPAVWLLAVLGVLYAPMALIAAATDLSCGYILNPIFVAKTIFHMGKDYFLAVLAVVLVLLLAGGVAALLGAGLALLPVPFLGRWLSFTVELYPAFVAAGILGNLVYLHGELLDWGRSEEYQEPVLRGVEPRGQIRPKPADKPEPPPARDPLAISSLKPGPAMAIEPLAPGPDVVAGLPSAIDLDMVPPAEAPPPAERKDDKPPSLLRFGIELPPELLEAQAFIEAKAPAAPEPAPAPSPVPATAPAAPESAAPPSPAPPAPQLPAPPALASPPVAASPPAPSPATPSAPVTAFVEPRPGPLNISAAPTVVGFAVSVPASEAAPTRIGHEAVQPKPPEPASEGGKERSDP